MVSAGKGKKGGGKKKKASKKAKDPLAAEIDALQKEESIKQRQEQMRQRLTQMLEEEERYLKLNSFKLEQVWRRIMRSLKSENLKKEVEVLSQTHERKLDQKDAMIQMLFRDLEDVEEQYNMALRSHLLAVDELIQLQERRVAALSADFEKELATLQNEFESERADIEAWHDKEKEEINLIMNSMRKEADEQDDEARQEFQSQQEELRNKNSEDYNMLKITLELAITEYQNRITEENNKYVSATGDKYEEYKMLVKKDKATAKKIEQQMRNIHRLQESLAHWRAKLNNNNKECQERNKLLREEKDIISGHFKVLKGKMNKFRDQERRRLTDMVVNAKECHDTLNQKKEQAERIIKLGELCRKLESEREKILPFHVNAIDEEVEEEVREMMQNHPEKFVGSAKWSVLENFYKRFNKVLLDKLAIEKERERLMEENEKLRDLLKQYLDGVTVNPEVMANANPLMIVTQNIPGQRESRSGPRLRLGQQREYVTVVEGNSAVNATGRHYR